LSDAVIGDPDAGAMSGFTRRSFLAGAIAAALLPELVVPAPYERLNLNGDARVVDPLDAFAERGRLYAEALARSMAQTRWEAMAQTRWEVMARVLQRVERDPYQMVMRCVPGR
jgi:hypothetical protein